MEHEDKSTVFHQKTCAQVRETSPSMIMFHLFIFVSTLGFVIPWMLGLALVSSSKWYGSIPFEAKCQLRGIQRRLSRGEAKIMGKIFPEGRLFSYSFYGYCLVNMALSEPEDSQFRKMAIREMEKLLPVVEGLLEEEPFNECEMLTPKGGIILAGHGNLLRAGYLLIGGNDEEILESFHKNSFILYGEFMRRQVGSVESYPGLIWPVDNICALESLRLHDVLFRTDYIEAGKRWVEWMSSNTDRESGMMVAQISAAGDVWDGPRGCALSWSMALLPGFAPDFASSQYDLYRSAWFIRVGPITGIREWRPGKEGEMNCDTGPIIGGIGAAASGLGIAAAKVHGDIEALEELLRGAELFGFPIWNIRGEKNYFFGKAVLLDVLVLWGKTLRVWDHPVKIKAGRKEHVRFGFWVVFSVLTVICISVLYLLFNSVKRKYLRFKRSSRKLSTTNVSFLTFQGVVLAVWLIFPCFLWTYALIFIGISAIIEKRFSGLTAKNKAAGYNQF